MQVLIVLYCANIVLLFIQLINSPPPSLNES